MEARKAGVSHYGLSCIPHDIVGCYDRNYILKCTARVLCLENFAGQSTNHNLDSCHRPQWHRCRRFLHRDILSANQCSHNAIHCSFKRNFWTANLHRDLPCTLHWFTGRCVQGVGGGGIIILSLVIFTNIVPLRFRSKYYGIMYVMVILITGLVLRN